VSVPTSGQVCGVCAAPLRPAARFCGRCGAEQGLMIPREQGVGEEREAAPTERRPLRARGLIVAIVGYFVMFLPGLYLLARTALPTHDEMAAIEFFAGFVGLACLAILGRDALRTLVPRAPSPLVCAVAVAATAGVLGVVALLSEAVPWLFMDTADLFAVAGTSTAMALVYIAVIPSVTEEILFRGAVLGGLTDLMRDRTAILASALIFAIAHVSVPSMLHLTLLGVVLGWVRIRSGSIWPGVCRHGGYNAAVYLTGL
jgi:membrane protease YdiL (CAAX protease family)